MRVLTQKKRVYATNTHIFIIWMVGTSVILLMISGIFLRNQIRPIQRLAEAAEEFGKGRDTPEFRPSGASEVRRASASLSKCATAFSAKSSSAHHAGRGQPRFAHPSPA